MSDAVDDKLVRACRPGDKEAYAALVERHYRHVFALCLGMVANAHDAEDLAQEAMLKGFSSILERTRVRRFEPWIPKIARNQCLDYLRQQKRTKAAGTKLRVEHAENASASYDLGQAVARLPLELRLPLTMYYFERKKPDHIARILNVYHSLAGRESGRQGASCMPC